MKKTSLRLAVTLTLFAAAQASYAVNYTGKLLEIGSLSGRNSAVSINDNLQIAGFAQAPYQTGGAPVQHAGMWDGGTAKFTDLTPQLNGFARANGVNNAGNVVGTIGSDLHPETQTAVVWNGNDMTVLQGNSAGANAINNHDVIVGYAGNQAHKWENGVGTALAVTSDSEYSSATAVNDHGAIVGFISSGAYFQARATKWNGDKISTLDFARNDVATYAQSINNAGQVVGYGFDFDEVRHAELWSADGKVTVLTGPEDGTIHSSAFGINNSGWIVGSASTGLDTYGVLWMGTTGINLNQYLDRGLYDSGWRITLANGINDRGDIVAELANVKNRNLENMSYLLTVSAVPEPEDYAMLLAGLAFVGGIARRRRIA